MLCRAHSGVSARHFTNVLAVLSCNVISSSQHRQTYGLADTFHTLGTQGMMPMGKPRTQPPPPSGSGQPAGHLCTWGRAAEGWGQRGAVGMSGGGGKVGGESGGLTH